MPARQKYRLRARSDREIVREAELGKRYVDRDSGEVHVGRLARGE